VLVKAIWPPIGDHAGDVLLPWDVSVSKPVPLTLITAT
jgi:hypothetical protein